MGLQDSSLSLVSAGLDWITLTSVNQKTKLKMWRYFNEIAASDLQLGYKLVPGGAYGFYGKRTRHALLAEKEGRMMLQVSGERAKRAILLCAEGDNATRLDVQVTLRVGEENVSAWLENQLNRADTAPAQRGKPRSVKAVVANKKVQTVYIGKRKSDLFVRIYDKFEESGKEEFRGCVRLELEIKGKTSRALWAHMAQEGLGTMYLLSVLLFHANRVGLSTEGIDIETDAIEIPKRETTKESVTLGWWAKQVAPSVARYCALGGWQTAFFALFGHCLTEFDKTAIMNTLSIAWGN
jgi:Replication initiation factor